MPTELFTSKASYPNNIVIPPVALRHPAYYILQPLLVPDCPWQHISMDFNSFSKDKHRYNNVLVIMDYLLKESVSIPCYKTTTTKEMASLFIYHI